MAGRSYSPDLVRGSPNTHYNSEDKLRYELAKTVTLTPELYERLFLSPKTEASPLMPSHLHAHSWTGKAQADSASPQVQSEMPTIKSINQFA
ncbi:Plasma membrane ammonium transporter [Pyrenophora teres f. teres]|uniref:Plasma membrane ammonium transporter n=1 Tax=Pyrenophora teres f. teres TaxID=97479 RepID=A0A6S6WAS8_9PLEO|nr:Plasma membrane ammonium transporter [Pyrenophora teres f. teres]